MNSKNITNRSSKTHMWSPFPNNLKHMITLAFLIICCLFTSAAPALATCTITVSPVANEGANYDTVLGQSFTASCDGTLLQLGIVSEDNRNDTTLT